MFKNLFSPAVSPSSPSQQQPQHQHQHLQQQQQHRPSSEELETITAGDSTEIEHQSLMDQTTDSMRQLKSKVGSFFGDIGINIPGTDVSEPPKEQTTMEELDEMTSLTWHQRISGFGMCLGMGVLFICISMLMVPAIALFPQKFAFFYSVGSVFCVCSTAFLVGPRKQLQMMFESHRAHAALGYVACLIMTLVSAVKLHSSVLSILFAGLQVAAVLWYSLSYIPYARQFVAWAWTYIWAILQPILRVIASCVGSCLKMICNRAVS